MRIYDTSFKDSKTGLEMVLSEVSYNVACDYLMQIMYNREIYRTEANTKIGLTEIWTGEWIQDIHSYRNIRKFYYDEERGYLLGE